MVTFLDQETRSRIVRAIEEAERRTSGEIRVHVQKKSKGDVFREAAGVFSRLRMHRTRHRNAVLIFVAPESRSFAILGDRGIHDRVGNGFWDETRDTLASYFSKGKFADGIEAAVLSVGEKLSLYFPAESGDRNELSNRVTQE
jgi:uncharacterized membrane protein